MEVKRGDIYLVDLRDAIGSEQRGVRPSIVVQNDIGNHHSPTTLVVPLTTKKKNMRATHVELEEKDGVSLPSEAMCEQARVADKTRLIKYIGTIADPAVLNEINEKIKVAFGL